MGKFREMVLSKGLNLKTSTKPCMKKDAKQNGYFHKADDTIKDWVDFSKYHVINCTLVPSLFHREEIEKQKVKRLV